MEKFRLCQIEHKVFKSRIKFTNLFLMIADQNFYDICFTFFYPTAYGQRPKCVRAKHLATAEGENCAYGPTLALFMKLNLKSCSIL